LITQFVECFVVVSCTLWSSASSCILVECIASRGFVRVVEEFGSQSLMSAPPSIVAGPLRPVGDGNVRPCEKSGEGSISSAISSNKKLHFFHIIERERMYKTTFDKREYIFYTRSRLDITRLVLGQIDVSQLDTKDIYLVEMFDERRLCCQHDMLTNTNTLFYCDRMSQSFIRLEIVVSNTSITCDIKETVHFLSRCRRRFLSRVDSNRCKIDRRIVSLENCVKK